MKKHMHAKLFKYILVFTLIISISFSNSLIVFAYKEPDRGEFYDKVAQFSQDCEAAFMYVATTLGAVVKGDFYTYLQGHETFYDVWCKGGKISESAYTIDEENEQIIFNEDFLAATKDMLLQYQIETSGFIYYPTVSYKDISAALYPSKTAYDSVKNLCEAHGLVAFAGNSRYDTLYFRTLSPTTLSKYSFVWIGTYDGFLEADIDVKEAFVQLYNNETWDQLYITRYYDDDYQKNAITADGNYVKDPSYGFEDFTPVNVTKRLFGCDLYSMYEFKKSSLISKDGRKIKIYMGLDSFKNNTAGTRSVYLTQDFYDDTVTSLAINLKSMAKFQEGYYKKMLEAINNSGLTDKQYDDLLEAIKDIESSEGMTEDELEKILQGIIDQVLDAIENSGSGEGGGSGSGGGSSTDVSGIESALDSILGALSGIVEAIEGWGAAIYDQLGFISYQIGNMTAEEMDTKTDNAITELWGVFAEVGDVLKTKFPFSIPWDIHSLLAKLGGTQTQTASYSAAGGISLYADEGYNPGMTGRPIDKWVEGAERAQEDAPKFEIPFVIESIGIESKIVIDLINFEPVSKISRVMWTLVYCGVLIKLTFAVVALIHEILYD